MPEPIPPTAPTTEYGWGRPDPTGAASVAPLSSTGEYTEELLAVVQLRIAAAVHARWQSGVLVESGEAAASMFLDRRRVEALLSTVVPSTGLDVLAELRAVADRRFALLSSRLEASRAAGLAIPLADAFDAWGLSGDERILAACAIGAEVSPILSRLLSYLGGDAMRPGLPVESAAAVVQAGPGGILSLSRLIDDEAPLRRLALLFEHGPELPLLKRTLRAAPRLFSLARGDLGVDARLGGARLLGATGVGLILEHLPRDVAAGLLAIARRSVAGDPVGVVVSRRGVGVPILFANIAASFGLRVLSLPLAGRPIDDELIATAIREARLHRAMLVAVDEGDADPPRQIALARFLDRLAAETLPSALVIERIDAVTPRPRVPLVRIDVPLPDAAVRHQLWQSAVGPEAAIDFDAIASSYNVGLETIERCAAGARVLSHEADGVRITEITIAAAMRAQVASDLSSVATHLDVSQEWQDLVLPDDLRDLIEEFIHRARQRRRVLVDWGFARKVGKGLGLVALFGGKPGTGKSMAAGLIARELGLDAYQIDISRIMSKWIGETEKSLAAAFEAAEAGQAMLIFDEADALFGKRVSDVKSSTDRFANVETNYILNRLEWFTGVAVLTTNLEGNLDPAFRRRVSIHAQFPFPDEAQRELLWQTIIPADTPIDGAIPYAQFARDYKLSGGQIRNVALRAAFLAAASDQSLSAEWLQVAIDRQYAAYGKLVSGGELE